MFKGYKKVNEARCKLHTIKNFYCAYIRKECDEIFNQRNLLKEHENSHHSWEKPFECPECNMMFVSKSGLKTHESTHSGETPFACYICGVRWKSKAGLKGHLRFHAMDRTV